MSRVLKVDGACGVPTVRPLRSAWTTEREVSPAPPQDPELLTLREENETLRQRVAQQEAEIADRPRQIEAAFRDGEALGRDAGRREADDRESERLAALGQGVRRAVTMFTQVLSGLERLAPALAREGLAQIFEVEGRGDLVAGIVRSQLKAIETASVIEIEVSAEDFPDAARLTGLTGIAEVFAPRVQASANLKSGDCRIRLKLGTLDVGVDQQWGRLSAALADMAEPERGRHD